MGPYPSTARRTVFLVALLAAPAASAQDWAVLPRQRVLEHARARLAEPAPEAGDVLDDDAFFTRLRAEDEALARTLLRAKLILRDLQRTFETAAAADDAEPAVRDILRGNGETEAQAAAADLAAGGLSGPAAVIDWAQRHFGRGALAARALYRWDTLSANDVKYLGWNSWDRARWERAGFPERDAAMRGVVRLSYEHLMRQGTYDDAFESAFRQVRPKLAHDDARRLEAHRERLLALHGALEALSERRSDPALSGAFDAQAPLDDRLAALNSWFDGAGAAARSGLGAGVVDRVRAYGPGRADQDPLAAFSGSQRRDFIAMLAGQYKRELAGTRVGDEILRLFQNKREPAYAMQALGRDGPVALYRSGEEAIVFNSDVVAQWLRREGRTARDLQTDAALLGRFVRETANVFVHEAVHHRQKLGLEERGIANAYYTREFENNAVVWEAAFALEKYRNSETYRAALSGERAVTPLALTTIARINTFQEGLSTLRIDNEATAYSSIESQARAFWELARSHERFAAAIDAELARRRADRGGSYPLTRAQFLTAGTVDNMLAALRRVNSPDLEAMRGDVGMWERELHPLYLKYRAFSAELADEEQRIHRAITGGMPATRVPALEDQ